MTNSIPNSRLAEIDAFIANVVNRARPVLAATPKESRAAVMKEMRDGFERTYAVMLGQAGPHSEEAILITEKIRDALIGLGDQA